MNFSNFDKRLVIAVGIVLVLVLAGVGYSVYQKSKQSADLSTDAAQRAAREEVRKLVSEVGKLIALPSGEDPTVATVTDVTKLKDQPFFQKAKNGDKVLIYAQARKAILYDPRAKKILDVAPINIGSPSATLGTGPSAQVAEPKVVLRNGTTTVGLATKIENELKASIPTINIVNKENASKTDFEKTIIVAINEAGKDLAERLATLLKAEVGELPSGESKPKDGDVLVILGKDSI